MQSDDGAKRKLPKIDPLLMEIARIVNDIQIAYSNRIKAGGEVLSSFGVKEIRQLVQSSEQEATQRETLLRADLAWCLGKLRGLGYPVEHLEIKHQLTQSEGRKG